jgi:hypothetical protein
VVPQQDQVLFEAGDPLRHATFPHDTVIPLVAALKDGRSAEMAVYGHEGVMSCLDGARSCNPVLTHLVFHLVPPSRCEPK